MGNQSGQSSQWPQQPGQPPTWYPPGQGWGSPQQPQPPYPGQRQYPVPPNTHYRPQQPNTPYPPEPQYPPRWTPPQVPPQYYQQFQQPPPKKRPKSCLIVLAVCIAIVVLAGVVSSLSGQQSGSSTNDTSTTQASIQPTLVTTSTPQSIHYPPTTEADLRGLAVKGDVSAIHTFHSESVGLTGACPQPKREVTVDPSVTGQRLAEDLLAYFYAQQLDSPCGSIVFAYHNQAEANGVYTAGRINFDVTDSSGAENVDPNANNLKHTLTLDIGGADTNQEYVVTY